MTTTTQKLAVDGGTPVIDYALPTVNNSSGRSLGKEEIKELTEVIEGGNMGFISGSKGKMLQEKFRAKYGMDVAICVSSGTAALHTAMNFLDLDSGDEVLVPSITDIGTILGVMLQNADPVFVDVDLITQNMDPDDIERHITPRTKAIIPVHLYGFPCDMDRIMSIARKHKLYVVEDCAQAIFTKYKGQLVGTFGDLTCISFQQSKQMTTGDGGVVMTRKDQLCGRKLIHCHDKAWPREKYRDHLFLAPNYHFTDLQAAVGIAQYDKLDAMIDGRRKSALHLSGLLADLNGVYPQGDTADGFHTFFNYDLPIDPDAFTVDNRVLAKALTAEGVTCYPSFIPQPIYMYDVVAKNYPITLDMCPKAVKACYSMLYIPWSEKTTVKHAEDIGKAIKKVLHYYAK
ncbi:MAG: DegT/DnrJ/EryC1/StrS family aminotransferase [Planctomycetota bacterium]|jgi:dTDP-4-amino-4,6-dideoxygalactose transaminase|nr:DegT/DnrJ/EryC1/StrS family aminotransferase [Planctomycetota bacterium]